MKKYFEVYTAERNNMYSNNNESIIIKARKKPSIVGAYDKLKNHIQKIMLFIQ